MQAGERSGERGKGKMRGGHDPSELGRRSAAARRAKNEPEQPAENPQAELDQLVLAATSGAKLAAQLAVLGASTRPQDIAALLAMREAALARMDAGQAGQQGMTPDERTALMAWVRAGSPPLGSCPHCGEQLS